MRKTAVIFILILSFTCLARPVWGQETPTPEPSGTICFLAFDDTNGDGVFDMGERLKAGVNVIISNTTATLFDYDTDGASEPFCLDRLEPSRYIITWSASGTVTPTTETEIIVSLAADEVVELEFGMQTPATAVPTATATPTAVVTPLPTLPPPGPTATPDDTGTIYEEVYPNDSLWNIAARAQISLSTLLELNNMTENSLIHPGDRLIVGYAQPVDTPTAEPVTPTVTPTRLPPTPTNTAVPPPRTAICLVAFDDADQNGSRDAGESIKSAVAFTVFNQDRVVGNYITDGQSEPFCLDELSPGSYQVTRSSRPDEILTTEGNGIIVVGRGDVITLEFGSYTRPVDPAVQPIASQLDTPTPTPLLVAATPIEGTPTGNSDPPPNEPGVMMYIVGGVVAVLLLGAVVILVAGKK